MGIWMTQYNKHKFEKFHIKNLEVRMSKRGCFVLKTFDNYWPTFISSLLNTLSTTIDIPLLEMRKLRQTCQILSPRSVVGLEFRSRLSDIRSVALNHCTIPALYTPFLRVSALPDSTVLLPQLHENEWFSSTGQLYL